MIKVTLIISKTYKSLALEWISEYLDKSKFELSFILLNEKEGTFERYLRERGFEVHRVMYKGKKSLLPALLSTRKLLKQIQPDIVHAHFFEATVIGLTAARMAGVKKRIYTRHHSTYHHDYFPSAIKYDLYANRLATQIIAITDLVKKVLLKEGVPESKICMIKHRFKIEEFLEVDEKRIRHVAQLYNPRGMRPVIGVISRYTHWKGIQYTIPAFGQLLKQYPDALLVLANARGDYAPQIQHLLKDIPARNYIEIPFEEDVAALYRLFDVFVHVPVNEHAEAFGYIYIEPMLAGVPAVFTLSGIGNEFVRDGKNALVVGYKDSEAIHQAIVTLLQDQKLTQAITAVGKQEAREQFGLQLMINELEELYLN